MDIRFRPIIGLLLLTSLFIFLAGRRSAAYDPDSPFNGRASIDGLLQLELNVTPPVSMPGDTLLLTLRIRNTTKVTASPVVILRLPPGLHLGASRMSPGMTVNLHTNELNWLPILPANGGEQQTEIALRVESANVAQPAQAITAVIRYEGEKQTANAPIWVGLPPQINRILPPPQVAVGQPVQLLADIGGSGPVIQEWDLGDGRRVAVNDPIVVFAAPGEYRVTLEAANPLTAVRHTTAISIVPQPAAEFSPDDDTPGAGQPVTFFNQSGGQQPLLYRWDFGDGTIATEAEPTHQYDLPGTYNVHLIVENQFGQSEAFWPVVVGAPPIADMEITASALAGQPINGQAFGDDTVTLFRWDMGDGHVYDGMLVSHTYRQTGDFYVSMTAFNDYGGTEIGRWVHIDPGQLSMFLPMILKFSDQPGELSGDPYELVLEAVELDEPFVLEPIPLPENSSPTEQLFLYINEARRHFDLPPLNFVPALSRAAQQHVNDMAAFAYTAHAGQDGSYPAERLLWQGYAAGYAGEATAWGFEQPYQAVEFWINSPAHRRILLNQYATDVGVGYAVDYRSPNVWYWTAEFGNAFAVAQQPIIRIAGPLPERELMISQSLTFSWNWPLPLEPGQHFTIYRRQNGTAVSWGTVAQPELDTRYSFAVAASNDWDLVGSHEWQVILENNDGSPLFSSEPRRLTFLPDPDLPTPTPVVSPTAVPTLEPTSIPPTPTPFVPANTPQPTIPPPPIIVTATPVP